ncbi:hypothetical protein [Dyella sedimenti]|uniref:hypothetical protein n=1 Tax=Dyella sedimenti TaxID=2919947 RepID=UPI001FAB30B9|nr:hypothetical protein [Dyella sedimenti]
MNSLAAIAKDRNWQQSTETETKLWVRDKNEGSPYEAIFKVTKPDGSVAIAKVSSGQGGVAEVSFPSAFGLYGSLAHGVYRWEASVSGRVVAADEFGR